MSLPTTILDALYSLRSLPMGKGVRAMMERSNRFQNDEAAMLAGAAMVPESRTMIETRLDLSWNNDADLLPTYADEVIIGGGLHAAIYSATRVRQGYPAPIVLEASENVGGAFAVSRNPSFYLNSLNRPGLVGGNLSNRGSLNYLPGSLIQPADISMGEFQTNADIAFLVRVMLASSARVYTDAKVDYVSLDSEPLVTLERGQYIRAGRVIDARGLGSRQFPETPDGQRLLSFEQLMQRADGTFPLDGMSRVAVLGDGDSGKVAIEMLLGIGPRVGYSSATLDYIPQIDWYAPSIPQRRKDYRRLIRERYDAIGYYLPEKFREAETTRVNVYNSRGNVTKSLDSVMVNGLTYDTAIMCTPYNINSLGVDRFAFDNYRPDGYNTVAKKYPSYPYYQIGPVAGMDWDESEYSRRYVQNANNKVSIFRTAPRTASLATTLTEV